MELKIEIQGDVKYLTAEITSDSEIDSMSLGMITNHQIRGFVPASYSQIDTTKYVRYNITDKLTAEQLLIGQVNKRTIMNIFKGVVNAMLEADDYMIDPATLVYDTKYIFANDGASEAAMICVPVLGFEQEMQDPALMFKKIMFSTQFNPMENSGYVGRILNYLNNAEIFSARDFKNVLNAIEMNQDTGDFGKTEYTLRGAAIGGYAQDIKPAPIPIPEPVVAPAPQPVMQPQAQTIPTPTPIPQPQVQASTPMPAPSVSKTNAPVMAIPGGAEMPIPESAPVKEKKGLFGIKKEKPEKVKPEKVKPEKVKPEKVKPEKNKGNVTSGFAIPGQSVSVGQASVELPKVNKPGVAVPIPQIKPQPQVVAQGKPQPQVPVTGSEPQIPIIPLVKTPSPSTGAGFGETSVLGLSSGAGETTVLSMGGAGETTVLNAAPILNGYLTRVRTNEQIQINKPVFRIGKERSYVDYFIGDNSAISRSHANIENQNGMFFITDTNSTNHTYVDGQMLQSNVRTQLQNGAKIRLANEDFTFNIF